MNTNKYFTLMVILCLVTISTYSYAAEEETPVIDDNKQVHRLEEVDIYAQTEKPGEIKLDQATIDMTPSATNTVNDLLRGQSNIQFDAGSRSGLLGGEITPPKISINGGKHYENNFMINGISNNSSLNPSGFGDAGPGVAPTGDSQGIFLDPSMIESLEVYTENVPAKYGDFVGGVINATLRDASTTEWHGGVSYRHTSDNWASFHYTEDDQDALEGTPNSGGYDIQPRFTKGHFTAFLEAPIWRDSMGMMLSYSNNSSEIPQNLEVSNRKEVTAERLNENIMLRLNTADNENFYAALTAIYAPYEAVNVYSRYKDGGDFAVQGGGTSLILNTHYDFDFAQWSNDFGYSNTEVSSKSDDILYTWLAGNGLDWATIGNGTTQALNVDGGFGDYESFQDVFSFKSIMDFEPLGSSIIHNLDAGFEFKHVITQTDVEGYTAFLGIRASTNIVGSYEDGIVAGANGQAARFRTVYDAHDAEIDYSSFAFFLEDTMDWERVTFRAGLRVTYDDLMENLDIAPRLFANVDILNDDRYNIFGGLNRYYGTQILERIIRPGTGRTFYSRSVSTTGAVGAWNNGSRTNNNRAYELRELDNPYTDEFTLGASADIFDTLFRVQVVQRNYEDQLNADFIRTTLPTTFHYTYTNEGTSEYLGITLVAERTFDFNTFGKHAMELSATWSKVEGNTVDWTSGAFDQSGTAEYDEALVNLDGALVSASNLPANNFNSPWILAYTHNASFWEDRFRVYAQLRWEQGGERIVEDDPTFEIDPITGLRIRHYSTIDQNHMFNADIKLSFDALEYNNNLLTLELDILNLFNRKNLVNNTKSSSSQGSYSMGRQAYLGIKYSF